MTKVGKRTREWERREKVSENNSKRLIKCCYSDTRLWIEIQHLVCLFFGCLFIVGAVPSSCILCKLEKGREIVIMDDKEE